MTSETKEKQKHFMSMVGSFFKSKAHNSSKAASPEQAQAKAGRDKQQSQSERVEAMQEDLLRMVHDAEKTGRIHITHQPVRRRSSEDAKKMKAQQVDLVDAAAGRRLPQAERVENMQEDLLRMVQEAQAQGRIHITHQPPRRRSLGDLKQKKTTVSALEELLKMVGDAEKGGHIKVLHTDAAAAKAEIAVPDNWNVSEAFVVL
eukprot:CAMPEP_0202831364 /NCGR_PEP_ID=MMETSP1389-20130828/16809_1 /ASSEMBLY_ACC=CAM_ASM_000865 /TAXON_ID=302021 /ORGANISM="Rhodomonas sp., Strain CCMP768" /LENGTH=202 /DNA_ID=CAMNT_0049505107 /DNA_START=35 /DNA_END=641 /DNA_ORIENTATION=+